jgi:transposase
MLTREDDVDAHALHARGWTISAIARHLGHDRKTIRAYVRGDRVAGQRAPAGGDEFALFVDYVRERLAEDPHLWATTLLDELKPLGFAQSYATLTRQIRVRRLRPACEACRPAKDRPVAVIEHPPGEETQFDWLELPDPPQAWGWSKACLFVGALSHSGKWRAVLAESMDQPHVIDGLDRISRALGGVPDVWRFDRMATVCHPASGRITASFAAVAKHYGVSLAICPARRGNRKGVVEKANHSAAQRWWRTLPDDVTVEAAQASLDRLCAETFDQRVRVIGDVRATVAEHADRERLRPPPAAPFPATLVLERRVSPNARVAHRGNLYSVPPEFAHTLVNVTSRLGEPTIDISPAGSAVVIARHTTVADGAGAIVADHGHVTALNAAALAASTDAAPHRSKQRIPPGPAARAAAAVLRGDPEPDGATVIDLARYAQAANGRNTLA